MSKAVKYIETRLSYGGDCTAKSQTFIFAPAAITAAKMYNSEQISKVIHKVRRLKINGVAGLCSKRDVINLLKELSAEDFPTIKLFPIEKPKTNG